MFISLNRKIIYSIMLFFLITSVIFVSTFYLVYGQKIQEEQTYNIQRNQQYIALLYQNVNLSKELQRIIKSNKNLRSSQTDKFSEEAQIIKINREQKRIAEANQSFDQRYRTIYESLKIFGISSVLLVLSIILLGLLISLWILKPINRISDVSQKVSNGNFDMRIQQDTISIFPDELDNLISTFNEMLDNLQTYISEIKDKEHFLQALIDSIPDGIRVIDKKFNIIIANKAYYKQVSKKNRICKKCYEASQNINYPCSEKDFNCPVKEILFNHKKSTKTIQQFQAFPQRHLSINAAPLHYSTQKNYIIESIRDLSEDINFSHQQKLSSLGFLSTSIAHEIKNHLGALRMILEHLIHKYYSDIDDENEEKKDLILLHNELISCIAVPERLLKLSRADNESPQNIDLISCIKDLIYLLDYESKSNAINVEFNTNIDKLYIKGIEADFKMAIINIMLNAIKAMENGGILTINIKQTPQNIDISFSDTGSGISKENLSHIFDPFFSDGHSGNKKGTGLGLAITKSIVEKMGGKINVSSTVDIGSCFSLSFPKIKNVAKK